MDDNYLSIGIPRRRRRHRRVISGGGVWGTQRHLGITRYKPTLFGYFYPTVTAARITGTVPVLTQRYT